MTDLYLTMPQGPELFVLLAVFVLLFGAAKLPDLARNSGQALRIFRAETRALREDVDDSAGPSTPSRG